MSEQPVNRWDQRYDHPRYCYGEEPNSFLAAHLPVLPPGSVLCLAEGEGRNAVFAATPGHRVLAVDSSAVGRRKALALAARRGVALDYRCADALADDWTCDPWEGRPWGAIVLCFAHLEPAAAELLNAGAAVAVSGPEPSPCRSRTGRAPRSATSPRTSRRPDPHRRPAARAVRRPRSIAPGAARPGR